MRKTSSYRSQILAHKSCGGIQSRTNTETITHDSKSELHLTDPDCRLQLSISPSIQGFLFSFATVAISQSSIYPSKYPIMMRAVQCHNFAAFSNVGGKLKILKEFKPLRSVLEMNESPKPKLIDNHVLIETHYAGIQYPDALQAQGLYQGTS